MNSVKIRQRFSTSSYFREMSMEQTDWSMHNPWVEAVVWCSFISYGHLSLTRKFLFRQMPVFALYRIAPGRKSGKPVDLCICCLFAGGFFTGFKVEPAFFWDYCQECFSSFLLLPTRVMEPLIQAARLQTWLGSFFMENFGNEILGTRSIPTIMHNQNTRKHP